MAFQYVTKPFEMFQRVSVYFKNVCQNVFIKALVGFTEGFGMIQGVEGEFRCVSEHDRVILRSFYRVSRRNF